jgi:diguanylate cyclase (GGDEF)-like protein/PAS domain S-box-containing protein
MLNRPSGVYNFYSAKKNSQTTGNVKTVSRKKMVVAAKASVQYCPYPIDPKYQDAMSAHFPDVVYHMNYKDMSIQYVSPNIEDLIGYTVNEVMANGLNGMILDARIVSNSIMHVTSLDELDAKRRQMHRFGRWQADYMLQDKNGNEIWVSDVAHVWRNREGEVIGAVGCLRDITDRVNMENSIKSELLKLANSDPLTNLANRRYFFEYLDHEFRRIKRNRNDLSVLVLDVDYFKRINDTYGHHAGDQILVEVAQRIKNCLRESDLVARLGGEEFGVFLPDTTISGACCVANRICSAINNSAFMVGGNKINCSVSIGVSSSALINSDIEEMPIELYKLADQGLYVAKNSGRNQVVAYEAFSD